MSPTRRQFLAGFAAGAALYATLLPLSDADASALGLATDTQGYLATPLDLSPLPPTVARAGKHGLPPSTRLEALRCDECGRRIGMILIDESDKLAETVCASCFRDKINELEEAKDQDDDWEREIELDEARGEHDRLEKNNALMGNALDRGLNQLRDLEFDLKAAGLDPRLATRLERLRELLEEAA